MRALDAWHHYLLGSPTMVQVFTDHKNLTYFRQPRNLNHRQARWLLDLSEFDLIFEHIPGKNLCAPDALSRRPDHVPASDTDNEAVTLLPDDLFVNLIDTSLSDKLCCSSASDPLVPNALHALPGAVPAVLRLAWVGTSIDSKASQRTKWFLRSPTLRATPLRWF